jgi:hypothetical protein
MTAAAQWVTWSAAAGRRSNGVSHSPSPVTYTTPHRQRCHPEARLPDGQVPAHFSRAEGSQRPHSQPTLRAAAHLSALCAASVLSVLNSGAFSSQRSLRASSVRSALKIFSLFFIHA